MSAEIIARMGKATANRDELTGSRLREFLCNPQAPRRIRGDVGLEFEIEGKGLPPQIDYVSPETSVAWTEHRDGSLRGECKEYVLEAPVMIGEVDGAIDAVYGAFKKAKTRLQLSNRCSTHVHLNISMLTPKPVTSLISLWTIVEEALCNWCGDHRVSNPFALRAVDSLATLDMWEQLLNGKPIHYFGPDDRERAHRYKYGALNVLPYFEYGSIEFRPLRGVEDAAIAKVWVRFLWALREEARTTYASPLTIAQNVSAHDALGVIEGIVEKHGLADFWSEIVNHPANGNLRQMARNGFLLVQPMIFNTRWDLTPDVIEEGQVEEDRQQRQDRERREYDRQQMKARKEAQERREREEREELRRLEEEDRKWREQIRIDRERVAAERAALENGAVPPAVEPAPKAKRVRAKKPEPEIAMRDLEADPIEAIAAQMRDRGMDIADAQVFRRPGMRPAPLWMNDPFAAVVPLEELEVQPAPEWPGIDAIEPRVEAEANEAEVHDDEMDAMLDAQFAEEFPEDRDEEDF